MVSLLRNSLRTGYYSLFSAYAVFCLAAPASVLSLFSVGSVLSFASIASTMSVFSIASVNSYWSIASRNCQGWTLNVFADCTPPEVTGYNSTMELHFETREFDMFAKCTLGEKQTKDARGGKPEYCDYIDARCVYRDDLRVLHDKPCKVKRKGYGSWRSVTPWKRPSVKLKLDEKVEFAPGWESKKLTLNSMVQGQGDLRGGPDDKSAYQVFKDMGYKYVPETLPVRIKVFRDRVQVAEELYAAVEAISDKYFMRKHFGKNYLLFEYEGTAQGVTEFKRGGGQYDDDAGECSGEDCTVGVPVLKTALGPPQTKDMDQEEITTYAAAERATMHFDGSCFSRVHDMNNAYLGYNGDTNKFALIPSGVDQTFRGCAALATFVRRPKCDSMLMCLDDLNCTAMYEQKVADAGSIGLQCASEVVTIMLPNLVLTSLAIALTLWIMRGIGLRVCDVQVTLE